MSFGTGKANIVHRQKAEIARLKAEIDSLHESKYVVRFAHELCHNIGIILANRPYDTWPEIAKLAFAHAADKQATSAELYRRRLPEAKP